MLAKGGGECQFVNINSIVCIIAFMGAPKLCEELHLRFFWHNFLGEAPKLKVYQ